MFTKVTVQLKRAAVVGVTVITRVVVPVVAGTEAAGCVVMVAVQLVRVPGAATVVMVRAAPPVLLMM